MYQTALQSGERYGGGQWLDNIEGEWWMMWRGSGAQVKNLVKNLKEIDPTNKILHAKILHVKSCVRSCVI